jgi:hypothetical protein
MRIIDYRVIDGYNIEAFQTEVLEALSEGYVPAGGVAVTRGTNGETYYYQAVMLEGE